MNKTLITSIGRTGTKSLSHFLDQIPEVCSFHEKEKQDISFLFLSQLPQFSNLTESYLKKRDEGIKELHTKHYIEVNPYLRFADVQILSSLGWKKVFIVRHPKTYLESVFKRNLFSIDDFQINQFPDDSDPISEEWVSLSRFQKLCWYYSKVHTYILASKLPFYKMEELITDADQLKEFISDLGINVSNISDFTLAKVNSSKTNQLKNNARLFLKGEKIQKRELDWGSLSREELSTYEQYCETLHTPLGYVL